MAVTNLSFSASVDAWVKETKARMDAVHKESAKRVLVEVRTPKAKGGNMPVDTGFLRNSMEVSTSGPASIRDDAKPEAGAVYDQLGDALPGPVNLVIATAKPGQTIWATFTAAYAARQEYGFTGEDSLGRTYSQGGSGFVRLAAQNWNQIVDSVVAELKSKAVLPGSGQ